MLSGNEVKDTALTPTDALQEAEKTNGTIGAWYQVDYKSPMATVDKTSIRDEVGRLKSDFEALNSNGTVSADIEKVS